MDDSLHSFEWKLIHTYIYVYICIYIYIYIYKCIYMYMCISEMLVGFFTFEDGTDRTYHYSLRSSPDVRSSQF